MLNTALNIGLTDSATRGLLSSTGNPSLVWDTSRRFVQAFAETVWGAPAALFARADDRPLTEAGADSFGGVDPLTLRDRSRQAAQLALHGLRITSSRRSVRAAGGGNRGRVPVMDGPSRA